MDYLALVKRLAVETGTELESKITSVNVPPATAYGETTEHRTRLINWIQQAWIDIQDDQDQWDFMVNRVRIDVAKSQYSYDIRSLVDAVEEEEIYDELIPFVAVFDKQYIWFVDGSISPPTRNKCYFIPPERFYGYRDRYNGSTFGIPFGYSIDRNNCLDFTTSPDKDTYYMEFEYKRLPQVLENDADVPMVLFKRQYHILIVYAAMLFYAGFDETSPQWKRASKLYRDKMNKLRLSELKGYSLPGTRT